MSQKLSCLSTLAVVTFLLLPPACAAGKEQKTTLDKLPKAVQDAVARHLAGATIKGVEVEREKGQNVYEVEAIRDGRRVEVEFAEDGKVLEEEEGDDDADDDDEEVISLDKAPAAVRSAVNKALGSHKLERLVRERENGRTVYEAKFTVKGVRHEVTVSQEGKVLEEEQALDPAKLPSLVSRAVTGKHADGEIAEAELVKSDGKTFYAVDIRVGKTSRELQVTPDGKVIQDEADDEDDDEDEDEDDTEDDDDKGKAETSARKK